MPRLITTVRHGLRPATYTPEDYLYDVGTVVEAIDSDPNIPVRNNLIVPSVSGHWTPEDVWNTGIIPQYSDEIGCLAVQK